jgi:glycosyltransferase involved in cell wall biosynthesis
VAPYTFTVFTPTYNRKHTLPGVYDSLCAQTFADFEWLIVDDGSADGTEDLVRNWQRKGKFPIRYFYQPNQGKHVAFNRGVREAQGELFLVFDSDDRCVPETLARFKHHWDSIPYPQRNTFSTITALCWREDGSPLGPDFPASVVDASSPGEQMKYRRSAERWGVNRTEVLRQFPFPEIPGEKFIAEGIVWTRMSLSYKTRFVNERMRIFRYQADGLSASSVRLRVSNAVGARLCYQESLRAELPLAWRLRDAVNYCRFSFHAGAGWIRLVAESQHALLTAAFAPAGFLAYYFDRLQCRLP